MAGLMYDGLLGYKQEAYEAKGGARRVVGGQRRRPDVDVPPSHGLTWSDGVPITAHDFVWTANFIMDNRHQFVDRRLPVHREHQGHRRLHDRVEDEAPDARPRTPGLQPDAARAHLGRARFGAGHHQLPNFPDPVGSGPFNLVEWKQGEYWRMEARDDYWQGAPNIDEIVVRVYNSNESVVQALLKGAIDYTQIPTAELFESVQDRPGISTAIDAAEAFWQLSFNLATIRRAPRTRPCWIPQVRRGDRIRRSTGQTLVDRVINGFGDAGSDADRAGLPLSGIGSRRPMRRSAFDPAKANALLDEAGYLDTDGDGIREHPAAASRCTSVCSTPSTDPDGTRGGAVHPGMARATSASTCRSGR